MDSQLLVIAGYLLFALGIAGLLFPLVPGGPLIIAGAYLVAHFSDFNQLGMTGLVTIVVLSIISLLVDFVASAFGAKRVGASKAAIWGATIGGIVGLAGGLVGIIIGPFIGGVLGELYSSQDLIKAGKVGLGTWLGIALGAVLKICLGIIMVLVLIFG